MRALWSRRHVLAATSAAAVAAMARGTASATAADLVHGIAMHGKPALPAGFSHFPYADPNAPKGGSVSVGELGSFDSLNPFIVRGVAANGVREWVYESLLGRAQDEPFSLYGLIARAVELPDDRRTITFHLDPDARFSDGKPVTARDVITSWSILKEQGQPYMRGNYKSVRRAEEISPGVVRFTFEDDGNREAPLLISLMPILASHRIDPATFEQTTLEPPVGSGPYVVASLDTGRHITYRRDPRWWGQDKPINRGRFNFGEIRYEFFRDQTSMFEAFKAGDVRLRLENDAARWAEGYKFPAVAEGRIKPEELPTSLPVGMTALAFNTRRPVFTDQRVRQALNLLFDFEWINRSLYHGLYVRTQSFFERSELSANAIPADEREKVLLAPYRDRLKPEVIAGTFRQPGSDGTGRNRQNGLAALALLKDAGYTQESGRLVDARTRKPFEFEMMATNRAEERLFQAYGQALERLGITVRLRTVDSAQRWARLKTFDFDMVQWTWLASLSPGNEQMNRWSTESADTELSLNYPGVKDPAVNAMIEALLAARERPEFISAVRALDRVLISGDYVIPLYHVRSNWVAHWSDISHPERLPLSGFALDTWWNSALRRQ